MREVTYRRPYPLDDSAERPPQSFKYLRLISSERARSLGLLAESSPVFVSPNISEAEYCEVRGCGAHYRPLVYSLGNIIAHHFHGEQRNGGIYFYTIYDPFPPTVRSYDYGWKANLEPIGPVVMNKIGNGAIAPGVEITQIRAFCRGSSHGRQLCFVRELEEGLIFSNPRHTDILFPLCSLEAHPYLHQADVKFTFKIIDGEVLFSPV